MGWLARFLNRPIIRGSVKFVLDELVPPIFREIRWLNAIWIKVWNRNIDLDFKYKAMVMSDEEIAACYATVNAGRGEEWLDLTPEQMDFLLWQLQPGSVLDVGAGCGEFAVQAAKRGCEVTALELDPTLLPRIEQRADRNGVHVHTRVGTIEALPFPDDSFDNVTCAHVLEHVRDVHAAVGELLRVARRRVLIVVPRERYHRYTANYHLHFFGSPDQLALAMGLMEYHAEVRSFGICYCGYLAGGTWRKALGKRSAAAPGEGDAGQ